MKFYPKTVRKAIGLMVALILLSSASVFAFSAPEVIRDSVKYVRYNCTDVNLNIVLPEDWTYEGDYSEEGYYLFFGPQISQYIELSINTIPEEQSWSVSDVASVYYDLSVENYGYVPLALPSALQFGDKFGMLSGYVENSTGEYYVIIDIMCIFEDKMVLLTIGDEINSFVENIEQYDVVLSSFTSNPSNMGTLEKFLTSMLPSDTDISLGLIQSF